MELSESIAAAERTLQKLGYPPRMGRKDLWIEPRAALGLPSPESSCIEVVYWEGLPRTVVGWGIQPQVALAYATGPAFSLPPPVALVFDDSGNATAFEYDGSRFCAAAAAPLWKQTLAKPPGCISPAQASRVIKEVAEGNRNWFRDSRSKKVVGVLPRIFPEGTVVLYELLQNAADSEASEAVFRLESETLLFLNDGFPFTENDVESISFVNSSTKPFDTIGFMGLGFKASFEISDQPEVHSPPFCFRFDRQEEGGELFPTPISCNHGSRGGYSTYFRFPLRDGARGLIVDELALFDGRPLLYIGANLRRITTPNGDFHLELVQTLDQAQMLAVSESATKSRTDYAVFCKGWEPSLEALQEFARDRNLELSQLEGRKHRTSIAIPLRDGIPDTARNGRLQVYLPTDVNLPVTFDVQGNFLVGASRKELRHASGPWNREHFRTLPMLVADVLEWAKAQAPSAPNWASWYDLIPNWREFEEHIVQHPADEAENESRIDLQSAFARELGKRSLIPAVDHQGSLVFVAPDDATVVDRDLESVLSASELARLSGFQVISPNLSEAAKDRLSSYIKRFGPKEFKASVEDSAWSGRIDAFSEGVHSRQGRHQLAKVLAYLERKWQDYPGDLGKCIVVLTQDGRLRASEEEEAKSVRTLPDVDIQFPTEELADHYDVVHQGFRRELNRPGEMGLDSGITQDAVKALERVAPTLDPRRIAADIILPLFRGECWQDVSDERLYRYTRFLMQHSSETKAAMEKSNIKVKIRGTARQYLPPSQAYFGQEYSMDGERLDRLCADAQGVSFLSADYLRQASESKDDWTKFFSERGVTSQPRIHTSTLQIAEWNLDELRKSTDDSWPSKVSLRASSISDISASHFALDDFALDPSILNVVKELYNVKPSGWKDRLGNFADILEAGWDEYRSKLKKEVRYALLWSSYINRRQVTALTSFAKFLKDEPWLPIVDDLRISKRPCELVLNTEENRGLANNEAPLSFYTFEEPSLISFLGIKEHPPETTPLLRLQYAVDRQEDDLSVFESLYAELAGDPGLDTNTLRAEFRDHRLIFVPEHDPSYVTPEETLYASRTVLAPRMAVIGDAYPNLEEFFVESLGIPTVERLEHFVEFLREYVWKYRPAISDNLRSAVESCYRRLFNHLDETQEEAREEALNLLKEQLGTPTMVFCGARGWVDTTRTMVLYPDTAAYEGLLSENPSVAIESHLKRLAQPLSEIRMLLDALNVKPMSEAIRRVPDIGNVKVHAQSAEFSEHISLLVRKAIAIIQREQAKTESTSRNVNLFLQEWKERTEALFGEVRFFESPPIRVRDELVTDGTTLREMQWGAYVSAEGGRLRIYMSSHLLDVFDAIADQLRGILRLDLLPAGLRDEVASLVQSNLARLDNPRFGVLLNQRLQEKGFPVEEDEELQRIVRLATKGLEAETQANSEEHVQDPGSANENTPHPTHDKKDGNSRPNGGQEQPSPKALTPEEVLAQLPDFDGTSYGDDRVVDLTGTSQWQIGTQQSRQERGGGGGFGGGGHFRNAQAYRDAYGIRGEQWVAEQEKRALRNAGKPELAERVVHRSKTHEGSPWDVESFEKSYPHKAIYIEVKSTPDSDNLEVDMSVDQIRAALDPSRTYYIYRVCDIDAIRPTVYIYDFKALSQSQQLKFSATNVSVMLPKPEKPQQ